jgi:Fe-S-cluster containining protein
MIKNNCPHLNTNYCEIYERRPLVCRAYPIIIKFDSKRSIQREINEQCSFIKRLREKNPKSNRLVFKSKELDEEIDSASEIFKKMSEIYENLSKTWIFDFKQSRWKAYR